MSTPTALIVVKFWKFCDKMKSNPNTLYCTEMMPFKTVLRKYREYNEWNDKRREWLEKINDELPVDMVLHIHKFEFDRKYKKVLKELKDIDRSDSMWLTVSNKVNMIKKKRCSMSLLWVVDKHSNALDIVV